MTALIHQQKFAEVRQVVQGIPAYLLKDATVFNSEKLAELHFNISLVYFYEKKYTKVIRQLNFVNQLGKLNVNLSVYKASRLIYILAHYELNDLEYLEYEIRSYKRMFKKISKVSSVDHLILSIVKFDPHKRSKPVKLSYLKKIQLQLEKTAESRYEKQILKYFDFINWIKIKLEK